MRRYLLFLFFFLVTPCLCNAAGVTASVDRNRIVSGESVRLTISVPERNAHIDISIIKDFKVISSGSSTSIQIINGRTNQEIIQSYTLIPLKTGRLKIPSVTVRYKNNSYRTEPIFIQVEKRSDFGNTGDSENIYITASVSDTSPYVGEQAVLTFRVYNSVQITNVKFIEPPDFTGFEFKEMGKADTRMVVISGKRFNIIELKYLLIPEKAGEEIIGPIILSCDILLKSKRNTNSLIDSFFDTQQYMSRTLSTDRIIMNVRPLPESTGNVNYSGLIGEFNIYSELDNKDLSVGDSTTLSLIISGSGNIMDAQAPDMIFPEQFKIYTDNPESNVTLGKNGYSGKKIFRIAVVPVKEGVFKIPSFSLCYFDVKKESYEIISTKSHILSVKPSTDSSNFEVFSAPEPGVLMSLKNKVNFTGRDILPLKDELNSIINKKQIQPGFFLLLILSPAFIFMIVKISIIFLKKEAGPGRVMSLKAGRELKNLRKRGISESEFLSCLYKTLVYAILSNTDALGESVTQAETDQILTAHGFSENRIRKTVDILKKIESARFSGARLDHSEKKQLLNTTRKIIRRLI